MPGHPLGMTVGPQARHDVTSVKSGGLFAPADHDPASGGTMRAGRRTEAGPERDGGGGMASREPAENRADDNANHEKHHVPLPAHLCRGPCNLPHIRRRKLGGNTSARLPALFRRMRGATRPWSRLFPPRGSRWRFRQPQASWAGWLSPCGGSPKCSGAAGGYRAHAALSSLLRRALRLNIPSGAAIVTVARPIAARQGATGQERTPRVRSRFVGTWHRR